MFVSFKIHTTHSQVCLLISPLVICVPIGPWQCGLRGNTCNYSNKILPKIGSIKVSVI